MIYLLAVSLIPLIGMIIGAYMVWREDDNTY